MKADMLHNIEVRCKEKCKHSSCPHARGHIVQPQCLEEDRICGGECKIETKKAFTRAGYAGACLGKGIKDAGLLYNDKLRQDFYIGVLSEMPESEIMLYAIFYLAKHCSDCKDVKECNRQQKKCNLWKGCYCKYGGDTIDEAKIVKKARSD